MTRSRATRRGSPERSGQPKLAAAGPRALRRVSAQGARAGRSRLVAGCRSTRARCWSSALDASKPTPSAILHPSSLVPQCGQRGVLSGVDGDHRGHVHERGSGWSSGSRTLSRVIASTPNVVTSDGGRSASSPVDRALCTAARRSPAAAHARAGPSRRAHGHCSDASSCRAPHASEAATASQFAPARPRLEAAEQGRRG
jgi:hypothetical protein